MIIEIFIVADTEEGTGNIAQILVPPALEAGDGIIASLAGAAVKIYRNVPGDLIHPLL